MKYKDNSDRPLNENNHSDKNRSKNDMDYPAVVEYGKSKGVNIIGHHETAAHVLNYISQMDDAYAYFEKLGGHAQAFGFTLKRERLHEVITKISEFIGDKITIDANIRIDCLIGINEINNSLLDRLELIEPYGKDNEEPLFFTPDAEVTSFSSFGTDKKHGKFIFDNGITAIGWNMAAEMSIIFENNIKPGILYKIEKNTYMNRTSPKIIIVGIKS